MRMRDGETWDRISQELLNDCAQLTKANSIEGNKKDNITVIYTPWSNLKKSGNMATGQVGFHNNKLVKRVYVEKRENAIVNRLNKTKVEKYPDLRQEKADREHEERKKERIAAQAKVRQPCGASISIGISAWMADFKCRRKKKPDLRKSESNSSGRRSTCMTTCIPRIRCGAMKTDSTKMTLCDDHDLLGV